MYPPKRKKKKNFAFPFTNRIGKRPTVYPKMQFHLVKKCEHGSRTMNAFTS